MTPHEQASKHIDLLGALTEEEEAGVNAALAAAIRFAEERGTRLSAEEQYLVVEASVAAVRAAARMR